VTVPGEIQSVAVQGEVTLTASMRGVEDGTQASFEIHKAADDSVVATVQGEVAEGSATVSWDPSISPEGEDRGLRIYYIVTAGDQTVRSQELEVYLDYVEITSVDEEDAPLPDVPYRLTVGEGEGAEVRQGTTTSLGTFREGSLPPGEVRFEWLGPFQLVEWVDETGPTRKAKLKKVHRLKFLTPDPEANGGARAWCDDGTEVELEERYHAHTQWVNLAVDPAKPEQGSLLKCKVVGRERESALAGDKVFVKAEWPGADELSKRDDPVRALVGGGDTAWATGPTCQGLELTMPADGGEVEFEVELGLAGGDTVTLHVGCTDRCDDAKLVVTNRRKIYYQVTRMAHQTMVDLEAGDLSTRAWLDGVHVELEAEDELVWSDEPALDGPAFERGVTKAPASWFVQDAEGVHAIVGMHNWEWFKKKFKRGHGALGVQFTLADAIIWGTQRDGATPFTQAFRVDWPTGAPTDDYGQLAGTRAGVPILKKGSTGAAVRALQNALNAAGAAIDVDGDFQDSTEQAVKDFQEAHGVDVDGKVGPNTMAALDAELCAGPIFSHFIFLPNQSRFELFPQALFDGGAPARDLTWRTPNRRNVPAAWRNKSGPVDPAWVRVDRFAERQVDVREDGTEVPVVEPTKGIFVEFPEDSEPGRAIAAMAPVSVRGTMYPGETGRLGSSQAFQIILTDVPDATLQNFIISHELGHNMRQAAVRDTDLAGAENRRLFLPPAFEFSDHPFGYRGHGHNGPHCYFGLDDGGATHVKQRNEDGAIEYVAMEGAASEQEDYGRLYKDDGGGVYSFVAGTCLMFGAGTAESAARVIGFCEHCAAFAKAQAMHDLHKDSDIAALHAPDDVGRDGEQSEEEADEAFEPQLLRMQLLDESLTPCANAPYEVKLASGATLTGTTDASGRLEQEVDPEDGDVTVTYTPKGEKDPIVLTIAWRPSLDATSDDFYLDQLRSWGYALQDEPRADSLTRFQGAYGLDLTGELDEATKDAIDGILADVAEQDDALKNRLKSVEV
jgi:hypothetical protein